MLGLPTATEVHKQLPKKMIYTKLQMNTAAKAKMDADISRITIVNEISSASMHIAEGERIKKFYVVQIALKKKNFEEKTIATLSKFISQNMLFVLECGDEAKLAIYHTNLMQTLWQPKDKVSLPIKGLTLDAVWENIIVQVGGVEIERGNTLDEQIEVDDQRQNLEKEIERLDKLARKEKQPKKKFELHQQINGLKKKFSEILK
jgi:hypothetical protein